MTSTSSSSSSNSSRVPLPFTIAYLLTVLALSLFSTALFLRLTVVFLLEGGIDYSRYYVYVGVLYFIFSILITLTVSRWLIEKTMLAIAMVEEIQEQEALLAEDLERIESV